MTRGEGNRRRRVGCWIKKGRVRSGATRCAPAVRQRQRARLTGQTAPASTAQKMLHGRKGARLGKAEQEPLPVTTTREHDPYRLYVVLSHGHAAEGEFQRVERSDRRLVLETEQIEALVLEGQFEQRESLQSRGLKSTAGKIDLSARALGEVVLGEARDPKRTLRQTTRRRSQSNLVEADPHRATRQNGASHVEPHRQMVGGQRRVPGVGEEQWHHRDDDAEQDRVLTATFHVEPKLKVPALDDRDVRLQAPVDDVDVALVRVVGPIVATVNREVLMARHRSACGQTQQGSEEKTHSPQARDRDSHGPIGYRPIRRSSRAHPPVEARTVVSESFRARHCSSRFATQTYEAAAYS